MEDTDAAFEAFFVPVCQLLHVGGTTNVDRGGGEDCLLQELLSRQLVPHYQHYSPISEADADVGWLAVIYPSPGLQLLKIISKTFSKVPGQFWPALDQGQGEEGFLSPLVVALPVQESCGRHSGQHQLQVQAVSLANVELLGWHLGIA